MPDLTAENTKKVVVEGFDTEAFAYIGDPYIFLADYIYTLTYKTAYPSRLYQEGSLERYTEIIEHIFRHIDNKLWYLYHNRVINIEFIEPESIKRIMSSISIRFMREHNIASRDLVKMLFRITNESLRHLKNNQPNTPKPAPSTINLDTDKLINPPDEFNIPEYKLAYQSAITNFMVGKDVEAIDCLSATLGGIYNILIRNFLQLTAEA